MNALSNDMVSLEHQITSSPDITNRIDVKLIEIVDDDSDDDLLRRNESNIDMMFKETH